MRELPKPLQVYRHFKGSYYQILGVARHSETGEELVIYRSLFDPEEIYARPLEMFLSETDKDKYPNARQKYRFTLADGGYNKKDRKSQAGEKDKGEAAPKSAEEGKEIPSGKKYPAGGKDQESVSRYEYEEDDESILQIKDELRDEEYEGAIDEDLEAFLDEKSYNKKIDHFMLLRKKMTPQILRTICFSLDFRPQGESLDEQCNDILEYLRTRRKYESDRLR